jgi:hypothetical protein
MKQLYNELTMLFTRSNKLDPALELREKFYSYSEKRKKLSVKMGKKNVVKMVTKFLIAKMGMSNKILMIECMYDDCLKKYGNNSLADKKMIQIFSGVYYHQDADLRINMFGRFLMLSNEKNYNNDICNIYLQILGKLQMNISSRLNQVKEEAGGEVEIAQFVVAYECFKDLFDEKVPIEVYRDIK